MTRLRLALFGTVGLLAVGLVVVRALFPGETVHAPPPNVLPATPLREIPVPFSHHYVDENTYSFLGASVIDVDGDGAMEVFVGGAKGQNDALLAWTKGGLVDRVDSTGLSNANSATYGSSAVDLNADGRTDLVVARSDGVTLYINEGGTFRASALSVPLAPQSSVFAVSASDFDRDGDADLYLSVFVEKTAFVGRTFNDASVTREDRLLQNDGALEFTDVTEKMGLNLKLNVFQAIWVDLDTDGFDDLVVAPNTGQVTVFRNHRGERFEKLPPLSAFGFWMCATAGDIDNDGDVDLFFSNAGTVAPKFLLTGDLREDQSFSSQWLLLRNDGNFKFVDATTAFALDGLGFAWGSAFEDLDADGRLDLLVSLNAEKLVMHRLEAFRPSQKALFQRQRADGSWGFFDLKMESFQRPDFGQAPIIVDLDQDHRNDVLMLNQNQPARAYLSQSKSTPFTVALPDAAATLGTRVVVQTAKGKTLQQVLTSSVGFMTDHTPHLDFELVDDSVEEVRFFWPGHVTPAVVKRPKGPVLRVEPPSAHPAPPDGQSTGDGRRQTTVVHRRRLSTGDESRASKPGVETGRRPWRRSVRGK